MTINVQLPRSWSELNSDQLQYAFSLIAEDFSRDSFLALCFCRFGGINVIHTFPNGTFIGSRPGARFLCTAQEIAAYLPVLEYLTEVPPAPVRVETIEAHGKQYNAPDAFFNGVPFLTYLAADNLLTGFITTKKEEILADLCILLYSLPEETKTLRWQRINAFYWMVGLKRYFQRRFSFLYSDGTTTNNIDDIFQTLTETTDAQIRALTGGDILKEDAVLQSDTVRALTELNYKVREQQEAEKRNKK